MRYAGRNLDSFARLQFMAWSVDFKHRRALKDKEELTRAMVKVANFDRPWWHALADDTERRLVDKVPAVAAIAPSVMFGAFD